MESEANSLPKAGVDFTFWMVARLTVHLKLTWWIQLSTSTIRRTLHGLQYVWRRPRLYAPGDDPEKAERLQEIAATLRTL